MKANELGPDTLEPWLRQMRVLDNTAWAIFMADYVPNMRKFAMVAGMSSDDADEIVSRVTKKLCHEFARKVGKDYMPFRDYLAGVIREEIRKYRYETRRFMGRHAWELIKDWWRLFFYDKLPMELESFIEMTTHDVSPRAEYIRELYKYLRDQVEATTFQTYYRIVIKEDSYEDVAREMGTRAVVLRNRVKRVKQAIERFNNTSLGQSLIAKIVGKPFDFDRTDFFYE